MGLTTSTAENLTPDELKLVSESWKVIMENPEENGVVIFKTFVDKHNYYSKFEKFKGIPESELPGNRSFRNHGLAIINTINQITESINDEERLKSLLLQLGKRHKKNNVTNKQFKELQIVVLDILRTVFKLPEESLKAWDKVFDIAFPYVFQGLEEGRPEI